MRKIVMTTTVASFLLLGGCATTGTDIKAVTEQVRQATVAVCGFLPTVDTVAAILAAGNPIYTTASGIANGICEAVKSIPAPEKLAGRRRAAPVVAGVVVHGRFVRK